ncbi:hypothetical protein [Variovorax sp. J31P207]|uniref:hypothetical protein n=1 Tax=Variovorax sp. J31P207 TaxID=3053510 RepID=UPI0025760CD1|nr:hypothetical protein [Variovorax sp. J31P207]MDM0072359.1 hypothetical protein [Variovorax sp. J31P207]
MDKPVIVEQGLLDEMNARIRSYDGYKGGGVVPAPKGQTVAHASGYNWEGPGNGYDFISRAYAEVREKFELQVTPNNRAS